LHHVDLPASRADLATLAAGDEVRLSGSVYTARDATHARLIEELEASGSLPYGLAGQMLFYAGPTPADSVRGACGGSAGVGSAGIGPAGTNPVGDDFAGGSSSDGGNAAPDHYAGAVGPTTAKRMDFATPRLLEAGVVASIGKGARSKAVLEACVATGSVYFAAVGGAAALLARHVVSAETVAYPELETEALMRMVLRDFPVWVAIDTAGRDLYADAPREWRERCGQDGGGGQGACDEWHQLDERDERHQRDGRDERHAATGGEGR